MKTEREIFERDFKEARNRIVSSFRQGEKSKSIVAAMVDIIYRICLQEDNQKFAIGEIIKTFESLRNDL